MEQKTYAKSGLETARDHIAALFLAYQNATGLSATFVASVATAGDPKFGKTHREKNFTLGTYDTIVSRLSAVWPNDAPWPESVPRQAPAEIESETLAAIAARMSKPAARVGGETEGAAHHG